MKRRNHNNINKMSPSKLEETVTTEKPMVVRGGASDFYTKFKRRHRFGENPPTTSTSTTTDIAQERSDFVEVFTLKYFHLLNITKQLFFCFKLQDESHEEIMDIAPSFESSTFNFKTHLEDLDYMYEDISQEVTSSASTTSTTTTEVFKREDQPIMSFIPTRTPIDKPKMIKERPTKLVTTTTEKTVEVKEVNEAEKIKQMLQSGSIGNDPMKIKQMMLKLKEAKSQDSPVDAQVTKPKKETPILKTWKPSMAGRPYAGKPVSPSMSRNKPLNSNYEDDDDEYDEDYDDEEEDSGPSQLSPLGIHPPGSRGRTQSSSSYFKKFARENIGKNFRRPEPTDETSKKANEIFRKYAKNSYNSNDGQDEKKDNEGK